MSEHATPEVPASHGAGHDGIRPELERLCERLLAATAGAEQGAALVERTLGGLPDGSRTREPALRAVARACVDALGRAGGVPLVEAGDRDPAELSRRGPPPLGAAAGARIARHLETALDALPRRQALLLALRYQAELGYAELAELLGVGRDEVGILLYRARRALREALPKEAR